MNKVLTVIFSIVIAVMAIVMFSSCNRYVVEGPKGSCGVWYPKKFCGGRR